MSGTSAVSLRVFASKHLAFEKVRSLVLDGTRAERVVKFVMILVVALGIWLRSRGGVFTTMSLWLDESSWTILLLEKPLSQHLIRPIGFMALTKALAYVFSPSEGVMRFLPWTAGIATVLMAPVLAAKLFRSNSARLLFVSVLALSPAAIDLSKEFKPYAVGLALHVALVLLTLRYCWSSRTRDLVFVLAMIGLSVLFAQDAMFAYPGLFLVIAIEAIRGRRFKHLAATAGAALVTAAVVGCLYIFIWSKIDHSGEESYWGKKYDVFYVKSKSAPSKVEWSFGRYAGLVEAAGSRRVLWTSERIEEKTVAELASLDEVVWLVLHIAGLVVIARGRRGRDALLLVLPLCVLSAFNWFGFWPQGPFRTNLFTLVYAASIASFAFESERMMPRFADLAPAAFCVLAPLFAFEKTWHRQKEMVSVVSPAAFPDAMKELLRQQGSGYSGPPETLVLDVYGCDSYTYYTKYHPTWSKKLGEKLARRFDPKCAHGKHSMRTLLKLVREGLEKNSEVWILASAEHIINSLETAWPSDLEKVKVVKVGEDLHVVIAVERKASETPPSPSVDEGGF